MPTVNLLDAPIRALGQDRLHAALRVHLDVDRPTVRDVLPLSEAELLAVPRVGKKMVREWRERLEQYGLLPGTAEPPQGLPEVEIPVEPAKAPGGGCCKCGRHDGLDLHHIHARSDGGGDEPENLAWLCSGCHKEWHALETISSMPYEMWLKVPPLLLLITFYQHTQGADAEEVSAAEAGRIINAIHQTRLHHGRKVTAECLQMATGLQTVC